MSWRLLSVVVVFEMSVAPAKKVRERLMPRVLALVDPPARAWTHLRHAGGRGIGRAFRHSSSNVIQLGGNAPAPSPTLASDSVMEACRADVDCPRNRKISQ
jgi:hypothetical protein